MDSVFLPVERPGLFRSRAWLIAWVKAWGDHPHIDLSDRLSLCAAVDPTAAELTSSLFKINEKVLRFFSVLTAYPVGVSSSMLGSIRSEYFQFPLDPQLSPSIALDYFAAVAKCKWDRLILPDLLVDSTDYQAILAIVDMQGLAVVRGGYERTYGVKVACSSFADYVDGLSKSARLKLFKSRKRLAQYGSVQVENIWPDREAFFQLLNSFHSLRWGKPCYRDRNLTFIHTLLDELPGIGGEIDFSVMTVNGVPVSVVFDVSINGRTYNLQSGYAENFAKGIALGTLHLGYQIEAAFAREQINYYDFMAGRGKNSNYKKSLSNSSAEFVTLTLVRNPLLSFAYKMKELLFKAALLGRYRQRAVR